MTYDCFTFFNELELLELRLNELAGVVDKFVLVEADRTHSNKPKPLYYWENRDRFAAFSDRIIHVPVRDLPDSPNAWDLERFQRNCIVRGLTQCAPDDFILVSDLDEIPRATAVAGMKQKIPYHDNFLSNVVHGALNSALVKSVFHRRGFRRRLRFNHPYVWRFQHAIYMYFLNSRRLEPQFGNGTVMLRFRDFSAADEIRYTGYKTIPDSGWNFTWMGGVERILQKARSFAHQECNQPQFTDPDRILDCLDRGLPIFGGSERLQIVPVDESFPRYIREHPEKFSTWIRPL